MASSLCLQIVLLVAFASTLDVVRSQGNIAVAQALARATYTCTGAAKECATDCSTLLTCLVKDDPPIFTHTCSGATPYCVAGACTDTPDTTNTACTAPTSAATCTSEGTFPNPTDCLSSMTCTAAAAVATINKCPTGYNYNSKARSCRVGKSCSKWTACTKSSNTKKMVRYDPDPSYYAYCGESGDEPIMFSCPVGNNEIYDVQQDVCRYNCPREGLFVDRTNCKGFIVCRKVNGLWLTQTGTCPEKYIFKVNQCVPSSTCVNEVT